MESDSKTTRPGRGVRLFLRGCVAFLASGALSSCVSFLTMYGRDVATGTEDSRASVSAVAGRTDGSLLLELHDLEGPFSNHDGYLVLSEAELEQAFAGPPVESAYRLPVPYVRLPRERVLHERPPEFAGAAALPLEPWEPWQSAGDAARPGANAAPVTSGAAATVVHASAQYRTGSERYRFAIHVTRTTAAGERRAVILLGRYHPTGVHKGVYAAAILADVALLVLLL